jgi:hypothetical protein
VPDYIPDGERTWAVIRQERADVGEAGAPAPVDDYQAQAGAGMCTGNRLLGGGTCEGRDKVVRLKEVSVFVHPVLDQRVQ